MSKRSRNMIRKLIVATLLGLFLMSPSYGLPKTRSTSASHSHKSSTHRSHKTKIKSATGRSRQRYHSMKGHVLTVDNNAPKGAKARCQDGSYSNASGRGACSHHGGV